MEVKEAAQVLSQVDKEGIKPPRPGILREVLKPEERTIKPQFEDLIVFGQGPVIGRDSRTKPMPGSREVEDINIWGKTVARAAAELKVAGTIGRIIISGGKTGGEDFVSEAELMRNVIFSEYPNIKPEDILVETTATNTLENFAYTINKLDNEKSTNPKGTSRRTAFLGSDYHISRIKHLAVLYGFSEPQVFSAEAIFKVIAERTHDLAMQDEIEKMLSVNDDLSLPDSRIVFDFFASLSPKEKRSQESKSFMKKPTFFEKMEGTEQKGVLKRIMEEQRWTRGLSSVPEYWIGYLGYLTDNTRLSDVLSELPEQDLVKMRIDRSKPINEVRRELLNFTKPGMRKIPPEEWEKS
ncbi:MAG TPA: YdcF family protein [Candidatus Levybacteria bacterium]|nr:YdcF family protein [Candidatus Levybacteria bacterium]